MSTRTKLSIWVTAFVLIAAACTSSDTGTSRSSGGGKATTTIDPKDPALNQWAQQYTGAKSLGKAKGSPFTIGYVNNDSLFPEGSIGVDAAVAYANAELNGADGHQVVIKKCEATSAADGARCGARLANDPSISLVLTGTLLEGNADLYNALDGKKAVIIGNGVTPADFLTTAGQAFVAGSPGVLAGMAKFAVGKFHPKTVAILANDNDAGHAGVTTLMEPLFKAAGADVKAVYVPNDANGTQVQSAMQAVGAGTVDVFMSILAVQSCVGMYDAIKALNIHPQVVTTGLCLGTPMTDHLRRVGESGDYPNGWYFGTYGYSYYMPADTPGSQESGMNTYVAKVHQYGKPSPAAKTLEYTGFAGPMFANVLTAIKFVNTLGVDNATTQTLNQKVRTFKGPMMLQVGALDCGALKINGITFPAICGLEMGILQHKDGRWLSVADGYNRKPIQLTDEAPA